MSVRAALDSPSVARINHRVRALSAALIVFVFVFVSGTALARPRVQVAPFTVRGDETLASFGPEVARAVAAALEGAGVETGAGGELMINGRLEMIGDERVRLTATLRSHTLTAEGPLEAVDAVATQLANKLAPLLLENDPAGQRAAEKRARDAERRAAAVPTHKPAVVEPTAIAPKTTVVAPAITTPKTETRVEPAVDSVKSEPPVVTPPVQIAPKPETWSPPRVDAPTVARPEPESAVVPSPPTTYPAPPPYFGGFVRGRVVAHAIPDSALAPGAGASATQALFGFLHRRMRLSVVPTGVGVTTTAVAADEAYRAGARAVVMARLESVEYFSGPSARVRLELVVIRDGRPVMRRVVESAPSDPSRRAEGNPVYQSVNAALDALVPELVGALADVR